METLKFDEETKAKIIEEYNKSLRIFYTENEDCRELFPSYAKFETYSTKDLFKTDFIGIIGFQPKLEYLDKLFAFPVEHEVVHGLLNGFLSNNYIIKINEEQVLVLIDSNVISFNFSGNMERNVIEKVLTHFNETLIKIGYDDIVYERID